MKVGLILFLIVNTLIFCVPPASGQGQREDAIWARRAPGPLTLDGVLDEPAWAQAESIVIEYEQNAGIPGSGWKAEGGFPPVDPTSATLKLLVVDNQMYLGAVVQDASIGGSIEFNRFDGLLMAIKDHTDPGAPKPPAEYFYSWWYPEETDPQPPGKGPAFVGLWANAPAGTLRTEEQIANWDAVTIVDGLTNDDTTPDQGYTVEMRFNLTPMGYDVTQPEGDIVEWNVSIYDCDYFWPINSLTFSTNRVWWQSPWGNAAWYDEVHVYARPDVTTSSGALPALPPEVTIPNGTGFPAPVIDGVMDEAVWQFPGFDIRYGDTDLRQTYPGVGPYRSGQFQPPVNGGEAAIIDPADATVKMFFQGDMLYFGFDVRDRVVQYHANVDRWDGFMVTINDRQVEGPDHNLKGRRLSFQVGPTGQALEQDYLTTLVLAGDAEVAIALNSGTTVDTLGMSADNGYTAELAIDLTALGYPSGLGDGFLFLGINHLDGDSFIPFTDSYGTRTWWFREYEDECCPTWAYLDPTVNVTDAGSSAQMLEDYVLVGNFPNPSLQATTIRYALRQPYDVLLKVFDVRGRLVQSHELGIQPAGLREAAFETAQVSSGIYLYRLHLRVPGTRIPRGSLSGRMLVLK